MSQLHFKPISVNIGAFAERPRFFLIVNIYKKGKQSEFVNIYKKGEQSVIWIFFLILLS